MQYIDGIRIGDYLQQAPKNKIKKTLLQIFNQLRTLDKLNINKFELTNPYKHIIITKKGPVLIDFERCRHTQHPKNISQFIQYIQTTRVQEWLQNKITLPTKLNKKAQTYKNNPTQKNYNEIIHWLLPFSEQVYTLCKQIPKGKITTYKEIAKKLNTKAYRAIGNALRKNPDPPIIPCHRVIASDGTIGGFMGQTTGKPIQKKITLLKKEGIPFEKNKIKNLSAYIHIY
ncbi:hypothetical protein CMO92_02425 [Candidatus Woesearchaeota archaeon]|nr:hypothetical protein [Candidatus Woesearchaeota archaeon]